MSLSRHSGLLGDGFFVDASFGLKHLWFSSSGNTNSLMMQALGRSVKTERRHMCVSLG